MLIFVIGSALREVCGDQGALGLEFVREAETASVYRLYEIDDQFAALLEVPQSGIAVRGEICRISASGLEAISRSEPAGVELRPIRMSDGAVVVGATTTLEALPEGSTDISSHGGYAAYLRQKSRVS